MREVYDGTSADLASLNAFNSLGLVITIGVLLRIGHIARAGRALLLTIVGSLVLALAGWVVQQYLFVFFVFMWGICGGVAMPMSRTLMQQTAPPALRARVMSFYAFSFMGAGPLGALWAGYLADSFWTTAGHYDLCRLHGLVGIDYGRNESSLPASPNKRWLRDDVSVCE